MDRTKTTRILCGIAAAVLLVTEILIGKFAHGWLRASFGDVLVVILIWALWRAVLPEHPRYGLFLPLGILAFAFCVEFLQLWGFCDRLHITNCLLRIIIGTGFSVGDLFCYAAGILPCIAAELLLRRGKEKQHA
jgi:hypothetical protein